MISIRRPNLALLALGLAAAALAAGCATTSKATFSISVKNATTQPVTTWLTKSGGPKEADWLAPEDLSLSIAAQADRLSGVIIPPGRTGEMPSITGNFDADSAAVLRVYLGAVDFDQMLATSPNSSLRTDVVLREGRNELVVEDVPKLNVKRVGEQE